MTAGDPGLTTGSGGTSSVQECPDRGCNDGGGTQAAPASNGDVSLTTSGALNQTEHAGTTRGIAPTRRLQESGTSETRARITVPPDRSRSCGRVPRADSGISQSWRKAAHAGSVAFVGPERSCRIPGLPGETQALLPASGRPRPKAARFAFRDRRAQFRGIGRRPPARRRWTRAAGRSARAHPAAFRAPYRS